MGLVKDNNCVGCPQGCIHCGRGDFQYYECDGCGNTSFDVKIYKHTNGTYCAKCLVDVEWRDFLAEMKEEHGEEWVSEYYEEVGEE